MKHLTIRDEAPKGVGSFDLYLDDYRVSDVVSYEITGAVDEVCRLTVTVYVASVNRVRQTTTEETTP